MSNEWIELKIDNLPSDILTGHYEFRWDEDYCPFRLKDESILIESVMFSFLTGTNMDSGEKSGEILYYRKPTPKAPSHEEIMSLWWKMNDENSWDRPIAYDKGRYVFITYGEESYSTGVSYEDKEYFLGRESALIPSEK